MRIYGLVLSIGINSFKTKKILILIKLKLLNIKVFIIMIANNIYGKENLENLKNIIFFILLNLYYFHFN